MLTWPLPSSLFDVDEERTDVVRNLRHQQAYEDTQTLYVALLQHGLIYRRKTRPKGSVYGK